MTHTFTNPAPVADQLRTEISIIANALEKSASEADADAERYDSGDWLHSYDRGRSSGLTSAARILRDLLTEYEGQ